MKKWFMTRTSTQVETVIVEAPTREQAKELVKYSVISKVDGYKLKLTQITTAQPYEY